MSYLVPQLDGGSHFAGNCGPASVASIIRWATDHDVAPTPDECRLAMHDLQGGTQMADHHLAWEAFIPMARRAGWELGDMKYRGVTTFDQFAASIQRGRATTVAIKYGNLPAEYRCSRTFRDLHSVMISNVRTFNGKQMFKVWDPLADGRYQGCPRGPIWYPIGVLKDAAGFVRRDTIMWNSVKHGVIIPERHDHPTPDAEPGVGIINHGA